jgi:hypothetical protein
MPGSHHPVREPEGERLARIDRASGQDHVEGPRQPDQARETHRAAVEERHAPPPAEDTEDCRLRRHA